MKKQFSVRTDIHAGYKPVQSIVYTSNLGYWTPGWIDWDSLSVCGSPYATSSSGVSGYSATAPSAAPTSAPPPPPQ
jgi:hypothetical protein